MEIDTTDDFMCLHDGDRIVATARQRADGWWEVGHWPRFFDRNQAITETRSSSGSATLNASSALVSL
jgi:hypothetical protein